MDERWTTPLAVEISRMVWAFPMGDNRKEDVKDLADQAQELGEENARLREENENLDQTRRDCLWHEAELRKENTRLREENARLRACLKAADNVVSYLATWGPPTDRLSELVAIRMEQKRKETSDG